MSHDTTTPDPMARRRKLNGKLLIIIAAIVLFVIIAVIADSCGGGKDGAVATPAVVTPTAAPTASPTKPTPTPKPTKKKTPKPDPHKWADGMRKDLLSGTGHKSFQDACKDGQSGAWLCFISDVDSTSYGTLNITEQVTGLSKGEAKDAATKVFRLIGQDHPELSFVVIYGPDGVVVGQVPRYKVLG